MNSTPVPDHPRLPTAADYQALLQRIHNAMQAAASGQIDLRALTQEANAIEAERRHLDMLLKLNRTLQSLSRKSAQNSKPKVSRSAATSSEKRQ